MKSDTGLSTFFRAEVLSAPTAVNDVVRKTELDAAISGASPNGHTHTAVAITDYGDAWRTRAAADLEDSADVTWASGTGVGPTNKRRASVKLKASGALLKDANGLYVDLGTGAAQAAAGNHTHAQLHNPMTAGPSNTLNWSLNAFQALNAEVKLKAAGGLKSSASGVEVDFGAGATQAAPGDHTHAQLHNSLTTANTNSLTLAVSGGQLLNGTVRRKTNGAILEDANGLYVDVGTGANQAAAGNHTHSLATTTADGLLSAADKVKLDAYGLMLQVDQVVTFTRHDWAQVNDYIGGKVRWGQSTQIVRWHVTAIAPVGAPVTLGLELNGAIVDTIDLAAGVGETYNESALTDQHLLTDLFARVKVTAGAGAGIENEASRFDVRVEVRPSLATAPTLRINGGGAAASPFAADAYYNVGSSTTSTGTACNTSGVTSPAPQAVYQTVRYRSDATNLIYTIPGLAKGITHTVRLHFNEFSAGGVGQRILRMTVGGVSHADLDVYLQAGGTNRAWIEEYTGINADSNGQLLITIQKIAGLPMVSGIEIIPDV